MLLHIQVFFNRILKAGHSIGNHTHNHLKGWKTSAKAYVLNVDKAQKVINNQILSSNFQYLEIKNLFRPPYGQIKPKQAKQLTQLGYNIIMWKVLAIDWDASVPNVTCLKNVINNTVSGDVVVFS